MATDLDSLSLKELKSLRTKVEAKIADYEERKKREAIAAIEEKAKDLGFSLNELLAAAAPRKRKRAVAKYANPANTGETWTGRGRKPRWVEEALRSGRSLDDLTI